MIHPEPSWSLIDELAGAPDVIVGIDEVGRGAWAGPVVAGAVVLPRGLAIDGLADSKLVPPARRRALDRHIRRAALAVGLGWVTAAEVDEFGLSWAVRESGLRALAGCELAGELYLIILDGKHNYLKDTHPSAVYVKADAHITPVAAASIVAKVARDRYMAALARRLPGYGFERHVGYGTAAHRAALAQLGASPYHRHTWMPLQEYAHVNH